MKRFTVLVLAVLPLLGACAANGIYHPGDAPERRENSRDALNVYPGDVRQNPTIYAGTGVGWAGIILQTDAHLEADGMIHAVTTFEHHYFDWQEVHRLGRKQLTVSPRGEGVFRTEWTLRREDANANADSAEKYASPGKLAIVYGVPEGVDDGTVILKYRYLRLFPPANFNTNEFDYGRFGEPFHYMDNATSQP